MSRGKIEDYVIDFTKPPSFPWTTPGPLIDMTPPKSTNHHPIDMAANSIIEDGVRAVKGIDKRIQKDGAVRYRARVRIRGYPPVTKTFKNLTTAKRWKRNTEAEIEAGRYFDKVEAKKPPLEKQLTALLHNPSRRASRCVASASSRF